MARRTKEAAQETRSSLLDAAERLFQVHGVAGTSLESIARAAGATRGAIYWHFADKADLFNAMMDRVTLPMESALVQPPAGGDEDPLPRLRAAILSALHRTATDAQTRRVLEVGTQKVEYVDSMGKVRERHLRIRGECLAQIRLALQRSARFRDHRMPLTAQVAARGLHALIDGLIQNWLLDPAEFDLEAAGRQSLDAYLAGLGLD